MFINPYPEEFQRKFFRVYQILSALTRSKTPVGTRNKSLYYENRIEPQNRFQE